MFKYLTEVSTVTGFALQYEMQLIEFHHTSGAENLSDRQKVEQNVLDIAAVFLEKAKIGNNFFLLQLSHFYFECRAIPDPCLY